MDGDTATSAVQRLWFTQIEIKNQKNRVVQKPAMVPFNPSLTLAQFVLERIAAIKDRKTISEGNYTSDDITEILVCKGKGAESSEVSFLSMMDYSINQILSIEEVRQSMLIVTISTLEEYKSAQNTNMNDFLMMNASKINHLPCSTFQFPFLPNNILHHNNNQEDLSMIRATNIQEQTKAFLRVLLSQLGIGFTDSVERAKLEKFVNSCSNVLCFIVNAWKKIISRDFPTLPGNNSSSPPMVLRMLAFVDDSKR